MTTKPEAERIAAAVNVLRPQWPAKSIETQILDRHAARPARDVLLALCWVALDPATQTPSRINASGPWWDFQIPTDKQPTLDMPHPRCPTHGAEYPCPDCRTELTPPAPHHMAAIRAAIPTRTPAPAHVKLAELETRRNA